MRVLILAQRLPYAPNRGDRIRVHHMLREIANWAEVDVAALVHSDEEEAHASELRQLGCDVVTARVPRLRNWARALTALPGRSPLTHVLLDSATLPARLAALVTRQKPDVTLAFCSSMARFTMAGPLAAIPCVTDMIDADSGKWEAMAKVSSLPVSWVHRREARVLSRFEAVAMRRAFATLVVNERERAILAALAPDSRIEVIENGVDVESFNPPVQVENSNTVVFCGVMNYAPNALGAIWLARHVWPLVRTAHPHARLEIVGASPSADVMALNDRGAGIIVTGAVDDVRTHLWGAAVAAAPLHLARGVQNKVLEAVAAGLPCVVTPAVADGVPAEVAPACRVAASPEDFARQLAALLSTAPLRRRAIAASANLAPLRWSAKLAPVRPLLEAAAAARPAQLSDV